LVVYVGVGFFSNKRKKNPKHKLSVFEGDQKNNQV
jgi:hypothetical protein